MNWEITFVCLLIIGALISFILEKIPSDLTALSVFAIIVFASIVTHSERLPNVQEALSVFANPAPVTIAGMFILSAALEKCGAIEGIAFQLDRLSGIGYRPFMFILITVVGFISAFVNNTPVVIVTMPIVLSLAHKMHIPSSKFLIPLSYASIFGGCCTAIGTSTNVLVSGILESNHMEPFSMFELGLVGFPLFIFGTLYLTFFAGKILPIRETISSILSQEERKEYITEAFVPMSSSLSGISLENAGLLKTPGFRILEIIRNEVALQEDLKNIILQESDRLVLACRPNAFSKVHEMQGIDFVHSMHPGLKKITSSEGSIIEGVIGPRSSISGKTLHEVNFRQHFRMILLAVHRKGVNLRNKLHTLRLEFGDTLLMMGTHEAIEYLRRGDDIILLDKPFIPAKNMRRKLPVVIGILLAIIGFVTLNLIPIVAAVLIGTALLFLTGCLKTKEGYDAIEWRILILIYGMLALGLAMQKSGFSQLLAQTLVSLTDNLGSPQSKPYILLGCVCFCTGLLTEVLSNNATAVLMTPIAISIATTIGVDPRPFIIAACIASSASFSTPIGYQTNTYVYGVGGYRFSDFFFIGFPLNIIYFTGCTFLIPQIWRF